MKKKFSINTLIPIMSFLILFCVFLIATRGTLVTPQNISNIVSQAFPVIIGGTGVLFVTAMGSTDLSVGANAALSATLGAMAASHLGTWAIFPVAIGTGHAGGRAQRPVELPVQDALLYDDFGYAHRPAGPAELFPGLQPDLRPYCAHYVQHLPRQAGHCGGVGRHLLLCI